MKKLAVFVLILCSFISYADEPPSYEEFKIKSRNGKYFAWVLKTKSDSLSDSNWELNVYKLNDKDSSLYWSSKYKYDGYVGGMLSDDGKSFVYVNEWYYENGSVLKVYHLGKQTINLKGSFFEVRSPLKTVSHELWLSEDYKTAKTFVKADNNDYNLRIITINEKEFLFDCASGKQLN